MWLALQSGQGSAGGRSQEQHAREEDEGGQQGDEEQEEDEEEDEEEGEEEEEEGHGEEQDTQVEEEGAAEGDEDYRHSPQLRDVPSGRVQPSRARQPVAGASAAEPVITTTQLVYGEIPKPCSKWEVRTVQLPHAIWWWQHIWLRILSASERHAMLLPLDAAQLHVRAYVHQAANLPGYLPAYLPAHVCACLPACLLHRR